jgi:tellurite resistance protein
MAIEKGIIRMLEKDNKRMREAGNNLAIAAMRVIRDYDGIHRLSLAVAEWNKAIADEGGRADTVERKKLEGEE